MKAKLKKLPYSNVELEVEIGAEDFEIFFERAFLILSKDLEIPGFRKGKVPRNIAQSKIGQENILMEAAKLAIRESYLKIILEQKLEVISQPKVEILKLAPKNPFSFRATFSVLPKVELPDYKKIASKIKKNKISVTKSEVEETLTWLRKSRPRLKELEKPAKKGDFVEIEWSSPQIEKGKVQKDAFLLGKGHLIKGLEETIAGMKKGEQKSFSASFPKDHFQKEIAGKKVDFNIKMIRVSEAEFPELNDKFAQELGNFKNLKALVESVKEGLRMEKELAERQRVREEILRGIEKEVGFEVPDILIETEKQKMLADLRERVLSGLNVSFEDYLEKIKKSEKELLDSFSTEAQKRVKRFLILREISRREKILVSDNEVEEEMNKILGRYPSVERAKKDIDLKRLKGYTKETIRTEKTLRFLENLCQQ